MKAAFKSEFTLMRKVKQKMPSVETPKDRKIERLKEEGRTRGRE
jgi:hypothetical protein